MSFISFVNFHGIVQTARGVSRTVDYMDYMIAEYQVLTGSEHTSNLRNRKGLIRLAILNTCRDVSDILQRQTDVTAGSALNVIAACIVIHVTMSKQKSNDLLITEAELFKTGLQTVFPMIGFSGTFDENQTFRSGDYPGTNHHTSNEIEIIEELDRRLRLESVRAYSHRVRFEISHFLSPLILF